MVHPTSDDHNADPNDPRNTHTARAGNRPGHSAWRKAIVLVLALGMLAFAAGYYGWSYPEAEIDILTVPTPGDQRFTPTPSSMRSSIPDTTT